MVGLWNVIVKEEGVDLRDCGSLLVAAIQACPSPTFLQRPVFVQELTLPIDMALAPEPPPPPAPSTPPQITEWLLVSSAMATLLPFLVF